tara:strand:+ start:3238 stop:4590 length:1353 start_codon:yes stop_codon:yes gene_type:complete
MSFLEGQKLIKQKKFGKALDIFLNLEKKEKKDLRVFFYLGIIYFELNNYNKSISYYNKVLKINPNSIGTLYNLAIAKQTVGNLEDAKKIYKKLIKDNSKNIRAHYGLYMLDPDYLINDFNLKLPDKENLNLYEKGILYFLLSKKEKKNKNYQIELDYLQKYHEKIFNSNEQYNISSQFYYTEIINKYFNKIRLKEVNENFRENNFPIFIVGLPRSGSTLVETLLTSGDIQIQTFGESHVFNMSLLEEIGPKIYSKDFNSNKFEYEIDINNVKKNIIGKYSQYNYNSEKNEKFLDKSLENFFNIEIILNIFPNAKFIHTFRDPVDATISIYQSMLPDLSWTHSIENILTYIDNYRKVLKYFKYKFPSKILDVSLENLTTNTKIVSKEIFKFCDLIWSEKIFDYYKRQDLNSKTLSFTQIRSKIIKYDTKKYKNYLNLLKNYKNKYEWLDIN